MLTVPLSMDDDDDAAADRGYDEKLQLNRANCCVISVMAVEDVVDEVKIL